MAELDISALSKRERRELLKQLEEIEKGPAIDSKDERVQSVAEKVRNIATQEKINATDVVQALAKALRLKVAVEKKSRQTASVSASKKTTKRKGRRKAEPKYRHPQDPSKTYAGKGPVPKWLKEEIAAGKSKEDFLTEKASG